MDKKLESVQFVNDVSKEFFNLKEHALIGISPFNSYYSEENLKKLFAWAINTFKNIIIFIPDGISVYTLQAMGYSEKKAKDKTRRHDNNLKNKAVRALIANGDPEDKAKNKIVFYSSILNNQNYVKFYNIYKNLYETDENFRKGCLENSKLVLSSKGYLGDGSDEALDIAVNYFIAELPIYFNTIDIFDISPSPSLFVYKDLPSDFVKDMYNKNSPFSSHVSSKQGYVAVNFIE